MAITRNIILMLGHFCNVSEQRVGDAWPPISGTEDVNMFSKNKVAFAFESFRSNTIITLISSKHPIEFRYSLPGSVVPLALFILKTNNIKLCVCLYSFAHLERDREP